MSTAERRAAVEARIPQAAVADAAANGRRAVEPAGAGTVTGGGRRYTDRAIYRRVLSEARPYWGHIVAIFLLSLLATPLALLAPVPLAIAVDSVLGGEPLPGFLDAVLPESVESSTTGLLVFVVAMLVAVELVSQLQTLSTKLLKAYTTERLALRFRAKLFRHAQRLSMAYHDRKGSADANYRIQSDAGSVPSVAVSGVIPFVSSAVMFTLMMVVIARIELSLALVAAVVAPVLAVLTWAYRRRLRARHREVKALESSALGVVQEVLTSLRVVKAFGQEDREEERFAARAAEGTRARIRVALVDGTFWVGIGLVMALGTGVVLFVGVRGVESGAITLGALLLVMSYLAKLYSPLYSVSSQVAALQSGFASAERAFGLLDEERDVAERPDATGIDCARGAFELVDVSFAYGPGPPVLEHVSFRVEAGARVGIAGPTGSGKTTLVSLLTRFYDPTAGAVLLDGVDLRDYRLEDLRDQFAIVLQDPVLFSTTIGENIAYGKPDASDEEIVAAARAADAHDFIAALPERYDTPVGERGMTLSGGERQRISLARAFLKDAPILILDEPTSSVDTGTEGTIIEAMERLMEGRTTFIVAHRLSTLEGCDLRLAVRAGRVTPEAGETKPKPRMSVVTTSPPDEELRRALAAVLRLPVESLELEQRRSLEQGTAPKEVVTVRSGQRVRRVFCKHGFPPGTEEARGRTAFELDVYRSVLSRVPVRVPRLLGAYRRADGGTTLVLEALADATRLSEAPVAAMPDAARWLGAFHGVSEGFALDDLRFPTLGRETWRAVAERTRSFARDAGVAAPWLETICSTIESADDLLPGARCVVHGEFTVHNVLVASSTIVPTDWESAAVGPGEIDLAQLVERWPVAVRESCAREYARARWPGGAPATFDRDLHVARALVALRWLAFRPGWVVKESKAWRLDELRAASEDAGLL